MDETQYDPEQEVIGEVQDFLNALTTQEEMIKASQELYEKRVAKIKGEIPVEILERLDREERAHQEIVQEQNATLAALKEVITKQVLTLQKTVRGKSRMAVYAKGRTTWDGKMLDGMSKLIPQLNEARKVGEPSVSFREVK